MDKVLSARVDEAVVARIAGLARELHTSKKRVIEQAVTVFAATVAHDRHGGVLEQTCGAWSRKEPAGRTVDRARRTFRDSMRKECK